VTEESNEEPTGSLQRLGELILQMKASLDKMADETVLDEEKLAFKRLLEEMVRQMELTLFSAQFQNEEVFDSMKTGWGRVRELAQAAGDIGAGFVGMADDMVVEVEKAQQTPRWSLKPETRTEDARKMLTRLRTRITQTNDVLDTFTMLKGMDGYEPTIRYAQQENMIRAHRDYLLEAERSCAADLVERGVKVPVWRRRPEVDVAGPEVGA
jgi:hypothetical protein